MLSGSQLVPFSQLVTPAAPVQVRRMGATFMTTVPCRAGPLAAVATTCVAPARWPCTRPAPSTSARVESSAIQVKLVTGSSSRPTTSYARAVSWRSLPLSTLKLPVTST